MQDQDIINEEERHEAATEEPTTLGCPSLGPKVLPSGFDGTEPGDSDGYEKFMTLPNGSRLVRFHGSNTIRLLSSRKGKSGNPNNVFEIEVNKDNKTAYIRRDDTLLFLVKGEYVGYTFVEKIAVSALKRYIKIRMTDNARHKRRRSAKRRAANQELINKELA